MKHDRKQLQSFARRYFGADRRSTTKSLRKHAEQIRTFIIDTPALSSGQLSLDRAIGYGQSHRNPVEIAQQALVGKSNSLTEALPKLAHTAAPVAIISDRVYGTVWHHGNTFTAAWVGKPTSIAHHASLTDTERERLLLDCRQLAAHGSTVYAVGYSEHATEPTSYEGANAEVVGLLVLHAHVHHGTEAAIANIREAGIEIVYVSKDSEHTVQTFAAVSLLAPHHAAPFVYRPGRQLPKQVELYASLTESAQEKVINEYAPNETLVVTGPLPEFWRTFTTFLN